MGSGTNDGTPLPDGAELATADGTAHHPFEFRGNSAEYFRIWVVNLALSLLTLGIFSAWAKVRRERYFYGNTWVAGAPFEYLASPINVLKGRLIAVDDLQSYVIYDVTKHHRYYESLETDIYFESYRADCARLSLRG